MSNSLINPTAVEQFNNLFKGVSLNYKSVQLSDGIAHAFFLGYGNSEETIESSWRKVSNFIALKFQSIMSNDFGKWNTYVFFMVNDLLSADLKYKIENDTFSSRKIVIEKVTETDEIIKSHILNSDLELTIEEFKEELPFEKRDFLWTLLEGKILKRQRRTTAADPTFNELLNLLKNQGDEI